MPSLVDKIGAITAALSSAGIPHAFGGALALAYATEEPRGTRDIDVNVFVSPSAAEPTLRAFPADVRWTPADVATIAADEQVRLWWDDTPVDLFFAAHPFHLAAGERARVVPFAAGTIRVLAPVDLAVFKALFDRPKDWVDIEAMVDSGTLELDVTIAAVEQLLGQDPRVARLRTMQR